MFSFDEPRHITSRKAELPFLQEDIQSEKEQTSSKYRGTCDSLGTVCSATQAAPSTAAKTTLSSDCTTEGPAGGSSTILPVRSTPQQKPPAEWWKAPAAFPTTLSDISISLKQDFHRRWKGILERYYKVWNWFPEKVLNMRSGAQVLSQKRVDQQVDIL